MQSVKNFHNRTRGQNEGETCSSSFYMYVDTTSIYGSFLSSPFSPHQRFNLRNNM